MPLKPAGHEDTAPTPWSLIRQIQKAPDDEAWRRLYDTYHRLIQNLGLKAGLTPEEADDAVQDTFTSVFKNLPGFRADPAAGSFKAWLLKLARWRITNQFQKRPRLPRGHASGQRRHPGDDTPTTATIERIPAPAAAETVGAIWEDDWRNNVLDLAAERLKSRVQPRHFQVFYLHVLKRQPAAQVAKRQGVSVGQVYLIKCRLLPIFKGIVRELETMSE